MRVSKDVRLSSRLVYSGKWKRFAKWATEKGLNVPYDVKVCHVANFLNELFTKEKLDVSTLKGYRSAISKVLKFSTGINLTEDPHLRALFSNFSIEKPVNRKIFPKWDLSLVLKQLRKSPYEPLKSASLLHLTRKTAFLLLLASGIRRGELQAIDVKNCLETTDGKGWFLKPNIRFMAKSFNPATGARNFEGFKIQKLINFVGRDLEEDLLLCPVRSLEMYLKRTKERRRGIGQLFITCNMTGLPRPAHANTISGWIKGTVADAYQISNYQGRSLLHRSTHEIRALSASLAHLHSVRIEDILQQCRWSNQNTFTEFYLRDVSGLSEGLNQLLPLTAAGVRISRH